jgi:uncharacterized protein (UPF0332 family)
MRFDIDEFKEVAEKLPTFKSLPDEGKYRTAIGRYYYYIFLKLRNIIRYVENKRGNYRVLGLLKSGKAHKVVQIYFELLSKKNLDSKLSDDFLTISELLKVMRDKRNNADYQEDIPISKRDVEIMRKMVEMIDNIIETISYQNPEDDVEISGLINILIYFKDKLPSSDEIINIMYRGR